MPSYEGIEYPFSLASLPKPIDPVNGRTLAAAVYSLHGYKRRKRAEIAVSVDGESINIYNIQTPRLITSYAISPQVTLSTPPCSIVRKSSDKRSIKRFTYISTTPNAQKDRHQIVCFAEDGRQTHSTNPTQSVYNTSSTFGKIVHIDLVAFPVIESDEQFSHEVILVHETGEVQFLSADLKTCRLKTNLWDLAGLKFHRPNYVMPDIEHVGIIDAGNVMRGLLKGREDVIATFDPSQLGPSKITEAKDVLCLITRAPDSEATSKNCRSVNIFSIQRRSSDLINSHHSPIKSLISWTLPTLHNIEDVHSTKPVYSIHAASGTFQQLIGGMIVCYDLSGLLPRLSAELNIPGSPFHTFTRLSSSLILAATSTFIGLYDVKYMSLQGLLSLDHEPQSVPQLKKRKRPDTGLQLHSMIILSVYADAGLIVGVAGQELIGIHAEPAILHSKKSQNRSGLLIDSIAKGVELTQYGSHQSHTQSLGSSNGFIGSSSLNTEPQWLDKVRELDTCVTQGDISTFEELFADEVNIRVDKASELEVPPSSCSPSLSEDSGKQSSLPIRNGSTSKSLQSQESSNGSLEDGEYLVNSIPLQWDYPLEISGELISRYRHKALYALGKIFCWTPDTTSHRNDDNQTRPLSISIRFFPPNVFRWLILMGYLTRDMIEKALHQYGTYTDQIRCAKGGDIVAAVASYDPQLHLLRDVVELCQLDITEIVYAIKIMIRSLDNTPDSLSSVDSPSSHGILDNQNDEVRLKEEVEAASTALDHVNALLEDGLEVHSETLQWALTDLHSFPPTRIVENLRTMLTHDELIFLIQLLRIELNTGGWPSKYFDDEDDDENIQGSSDGAILTIANLLSYSLDAIGTGGWLNTTSNSASTDTPDDLLHSMRVEISAALEGVHEATFMRGLLNEFFLFESRKRKSASLPTHKQLKKGKKPIALSDSAQENETRVLPLGLQPKSKIDGNVSLYGGQIRKKSKREVGIEISMRVPRYSFEKIIL